MATTVKLDRDRCCGNLECLRIAPDLFGEDEEGMGFVLIADALTDQQAADAREAADACPAQAITIG